MTDDKEALRQQVAQQIEDAFADTPYPGDDNIGHGTDGPYFEDALRGKHWSDLTLEFIFYWRGELAFLSAGGFRYYLPAFMLATLNHYADVDTLSDNLIVHLSPNERHNLNRVFLRQTSQFDRVEQEAILAFLKTYRELHPEDFDSGVYKPLLVQAITFWEAKLEKSADL